ncbi:hypothetical protein GCM10010121_052270 [Streptomyces brasiliensis]|uniref:EamA domain-containing protein n=1 Tax=Streptomyces brasiliensis TaxID=1954 RepID=A0A917KZ19_9ACTN|nr:hypothetical protein GCM10010121_052270 [Streptomyces brasiliensis]
MSSIAAPRALAPRRAWQTDLPVLLVALFWGASYLAAKDITTARTVLAVLVLRFAVVLPVLAAAGRRSLRALTGAQWRGAALLGGAGSSCWRRTASSTRPPPTPV